MAKVGLVIQRQVALFLHSRGSLVVLTRRLNDQQLAFQPQVPHLHDGSNLLYASAGSDT